MASQIETAGKNAILNSGVDATCLYVGLIYFDGVSTYTEITGGSYARQLASWATASDGSKNLAANAVFPGLPANCTINHIGIYSALTGGTLYAKDDVTSETFAAAGGTYTVTGYTITLT